MLKEVLVKIGWIELLILECFVQNYEKNKW